MRMRICPECNEEMLPTMRTFAEIDVCQKCGGTFLDAGEGASTFGADAEVRFLLEDGRAKRVHVSRRKCPAGHPPMTTFAVRTGATSTVDVDLCEECGGFFFDKGEGETLAALDNAPPGTFAPPPRVSAHDMAIADAQKSAPSFFARFITDLFRSPEEEERR